MLLELMTAAAFAVVAGVVFASSYGSPSISSVIGQYIVTAEQR
jgi:hypothetical protein